MQFGVFDHLDRSGRPLAQQYDERLELVRTYEAAGFAAYHLAEHHATPLGMAPSPSVFLAAVARTTSRIRFGPLVYPLPLYHPLRVAEEIAMLDHLSGGRLDIGFGRGASPIEVEHYGVDPQEAKARYEEGFAIVMAALTSERLTYEGRFHSFCDVPIVLHPLQRPHPRLWYGASHPDAAAWAASRAINIVSNATVEVARPILQRYRAEWVGLGRNIAELPLIGLNRHCVIADTDAEAERIAARAYEVWQTSFYILWRQRGQKPGNAAYPETFEGLQKAGFGIAGSPRTVRDFLVRQFDGLGATYAVGRFAFGDLSLEESKRSVALYRAHVMPALTGLAEPDRT